MISCFPKWYTMWMHWKQYRSRSNANLGKVQKYGSYVFLKFQNKMVTVLKKMMLGYKVVSFFLVGGLLLITTPVWKMVSGYRVAPFFLECPLAPPTFFLFFINFFMTFYFLFFIFLAKANDVQIFLRLVILIFKECRI